MIRPEEFPYITALHVDNCYTYQDFDIVLHNYQPFSHLILTGKNGSGKSTILRALNNYFDAWRIPNQPLTSLPTLSEHIKQLKQLLFFREETYGSTDSTVLAFERELAKFSSITPIVNINPNAFWTSHKNNLLYSYFPAKRSSEVALVDAPSKETEFIEKINTSDSTEFFIKKFKQYLVNQKIEQAFSQLEQEESNLKHISQFFNELEKTFCKIFEDNLLKIEFIRSNYEFYINLSDGRKLTFDTLSEGFSALLSILMDLFTRVDLIRKQVGDFTYDPCGVVLIDEPETHLHLQLQEQILPLLTGLFPNVQFIVATHSPAVIASIKNTTIFDLTTKEMRTDEVVGRSYSELMTSHFKMNNEYSPIADEIFKKINEVLREYKHEPKELKTRIQQILIDNERYISPSFLVELESILLENA